MKHIIAPPYSFSYKHMKRLTRLLTGIILSALLAGQTALADAELDALISQLSRTHYSNAVLKLYQKRLLSVLPAISAGADVNTVIANANGTTALHNACGLSHVEIVRWLVNHGANTKAKTAKGASVAMCVGPPNDKAINKILNSAPTRGKSTSAVGLAPASVKGKTITFWKGGAPLTDETYTFRQGNSNILANDIPEGYGNLLKYTKTGANTAKIVIEEWESCTTYLLTFTSPTEGKASSYGEGEGEVWSDSNLSFTLH